MSTTNFFIIIYSFNNFSATSFRIVQQLTTTATLSLILRKIGSQRRPAGHLPFTATIRVFWATIRDFWATIRFFELTAFQWDCKTPQKTRKTPNKTLSELEKTGLAPKWVVGEVLRPVVMHRCSVRTRVYCWDELTVPAYLYRGGVCWRNADTVSVCWSQLASQKNHATFPKLEFAGFYWILPVFIGFLSVFGSNYLLDS